MMNIIIRFIKVSIAFFVVFSLPVNAANWPTYQGNKEHSGYVPAILEVNEFLLNWQVSVANGNPLNPVTAADNMVFVTDYGYFDSEGLFVLDAETGELKWSKSYPDPNGGSVHSVNPPAYYNGKVYLQTGNHGGDTYIRAYEAETGNLVFQSSHGAQWERYYAPTIVDGVAYINGGAYGGMYAFDATDGTQLWFSDLEQYDQWTPAIDDKYAYAYMEYGLYVVDRTTGEIAYKIRDTDFEWSGWSMDLVPVLAGLNDVLVINNERLIRFDLTLKNIKWQLKRNFTGQPSVARGVIYAIDSGALTAWDQTTGTLLWSWGAPQALSGTIIVTDSHVLVGSATTTYAIDLQSKQDVWSFSKSGHLALSDRTLYIASEDGVLSSINVGLPKDSDGDSIPDLRDNCPLLPNPSQLDTDGDGVGDLCNNGIDKDNDEWADAVDNCPDDSNTDQLNSDYDQFGDVCDPYPNTANNLGACLADLGSGSGGDNGGGSNGTPSIAVMPSINSESLSKPGPLLSVSQSASWNLDVINDGDEALRNITVSARRKLPTLGDWEVVCTIPSLEPSETSVCNMSTSVFDEVNKYLVAVKGKTTSGESVENTYDAFFIGIGGGDGGNTELIASLSTDAMINQQSAKKPGPLLLASDTAKWQLSVENDGNVNLRTVKVYRKQKLPVTGEWEEVCSLGVLDIGSTKTCSSQSTVQAGTNKYLLATKALDPSDNQVESTYQAFFTGQ